MKPEEAIEILLSATVNLGRRSGKYLVVDAVTLAIEALEKQIGKKPKGMGTEFPQCECGRFLQTYFGVMYEYCPKCSQKVDWR